MEHSSRHAVIFTTLLCVVFSLIVSSVSVALKDRQVKNKRLDKIKNVLAAAGQVRPGEVLSREELSRRYLLPWCDFARERLAQEESRLAFLPEQFEADLLAVDASAT